MNDTAQQQMVSTDEPIAQGDAILSVIERAARDESVDIEKMERLLAMKERIDNQAAEKAFNAAMAAVQREMPKVRRNAENSQTKSNYSTYEALSDALTPVITGHGFACSFGTDESPKGKEFVRITCDLMHRGGHSKPYHCDLPLDMLGLKGNPNKTEVHGTGSTFSYGKRYLKLLIFDVALTDEDDDGVAAGKVSWVAALENAMGEHAESVNAVCAALDSGNYDAAYEAWNEIPNDDRSALWQAPTKCRKAGLEPPFTTDQIAKMKSNEWAAARRNYTGDE